MDVKESDAFVPPNPKEFDSATLTCGFPGFVRHQSSLVSPSDVEVRVAALCVSHGENAEDGFNRARGAQQMADGGYWSKTWRLSLGVASSRSTVRASIQSAMVEVPWALT